MVLNLSVRNGRTQPKKTTLKWFMYFLFKKSMDILSVIVSVQWALLIHQSSQGISWWSGAASSPCNSKIVEDRRTKNSEWWPTGVSWFCLSSEFWLGLGTHIEFTFNGPLQAPGPFLDQTVVQKGYSEGGFQRIRTDPHPHKGSTSLPEGNWANQCDLSKGFRARSPKRQGRIAETIFLGSKTILSHRIWEP